MRAEGAYLQGLHGEVRGVVVVDFPGVPGGFLMQIVSCLKTHTNRCDIPEQTDVHAGL